ncbi:MULTISPECIES: carbohydrate ABC transporter permease [unclassified Paenibacillus]|uniref:carbohydrate ABC transporter permease n=1 Tax=unclassified Paenibacillus TaxID=185978 RepID=UPI001C127BFE|nr:MULTISPECIES: carbohydrate ABC transporter permease [unclassified Paenibacillus]MBU5442024.1 carbohydrate ABC transporter permease [Paenibacillus sp. MSJ-34]CAH0120456.1 L-arabinose transport system permease protein AraQ [Paenibacillus sp. CECT 9249]
MIAAARRSVHYVVLAILAVLILYPVLFTVLSSFMTPEEASVYPPPLLPQGLYFGNFATVLDTVPIVRFIWNSFAVAGLITLGQLLLASTSAYAFAFLRFPGKPLWFAVFLSTMMIPWEVSVIPNYITMKSWNWLDTYQGLILPFIATAFGTFLLRQFFLQLPRELFDAAKIDGCGHMRAFVRLVLPLSVPALGMLGIYGFLNAWNMYLWPLLMTNSDTMRTVQIGISMLQFEEFTSWNLVLAGVALVLLPSFLLLAFGLKQLVQGILAGALKG